MIKMYLKQSHAGSTPDFWEENWEKSQFTEAVKFCRIDPIKPLFEKYSREGSLMLEGGCGMGQYLAYYEFKGRKVVGLDFAQKTLKNLRRRQKHLDLCAGDVSQLPFADEIFDLYYSGGVVEHFEGGAEKSLSEAHRVLKKDGILLMSVPYYSPLRRILSLVKKKEWRRIAKPEIDKYKVFEDKKFFQYAYRTDEFEKMLSEAGLRVIEKQAYSVIWGLYDIPFFSKNEKSHSTISDKKADGEITTVNIKDIIKDEPVSLFKRLFVSEDVNIPILGLGVKLTRWFSANLMMYVCVRD